MFVRESGTGKGGSLTVGGDVQKRNAGSGRVRGIEFVVASPLKAEIVDLVGGKVCGPVRDEEAFVSGAVSVLRRAAIIDGRGGVVAVGFLPVLEVEDGGEMVVLVQLIVELSEKNVLLEVPRESAQILSCDVGLGVCASRGGDGGRTDKTVDRGNRLRRGVEDRIHFAESVVRTEEKELVFDDGSADAAAELVLLMDGLGEDAA